MNENKYDKILQVTYKKSSKRKHIPTGDRAAQFAPFAALTGYNEAITEAARLTEEKIELDEYTKGEINNKLIFLAENIDAKPRTEITHFVPDEKKQGGAYVTVLGIVKKIQDFERVVIMEDNTLIPIDNILQITVDDIRL